MVHLQVVQVLEAILIIQRLGLAGVLDFRSLQLRVDYFRLLSTAERLLGLLDLDVDLLVEVVQEEVLEVVCLEDARIKLGIQVPAETFLQLGDFDPVLVISYGGHDEELDVVQIVLQIRKALLVVRQFVVPLVVHLSAHLLKGVVFQSVISCSLFVQVSNHVFIVETMAVFSLFLFVFLLQRRIGQAFERLLSGLLQMLPQLHFYVVFVLFLYFNFVLHGTQELLELRKSQFGKVQVRPAFLLKKRRQLGQGDAVALVFLQDLNYSLLDFLYTFIQLRR